MVGYQLLFGNSKNSKRGIVTESLGKVSQKISVKTQYFS